jgi:hypothetical protein
MVVVAAACELYKTEHWAEPMQSAFFTQGLAGESSTGPHLHDFTKRSQWYAAPVHSPHLTTLVESKTSLMQKEFALQVSRVNLVLPNSSKLCTDLMFV